MSCLINKSKCDSGGLWHWPVAEVGEELYYGFNWTEWLNSENDSIDSVEWTVPSGLTELATALDGNYVYIKLGADTIGEYEITCTLTTSEGAATQKPIRKAWLKVV